MDLKKDPNFGNYPYSTLIETLIDPFQETQKRDRNSKNYPHVALGAALSR